MMDDELRQRVAIACRVIALEGYVDLTLGHVSARRPGERTVWIKRKGILASGSMRSNRPM